MSVLIEGVTLVVRRMRFDALYPGGGAAFLRAALELTPPPRFACGDDPHLLNISFDAADHASPAIELLRFVGLRGIEDSVREAVDFTLVDEYQDNYPGYQWLVWHRHEDGFTYGWNPAADVGAVAGPPAWARHRSRGAKCRVVGDLADDMLLVASENGARSYLDLRTGAISRVTTTAQSKTVQSRGPNGDDRWGECSNTDDTSTPLSLRLRAILVDAGFRSIEGSPSQCIVDIVGRLATYHCFYQTQDETKVITCAVCAPMFIPVAALRHVLDFITRVNFNLKLGAFEIDFDGLFRFRAGIPLGDTTPDPTMVASIAYIGVAMFDRYWPNILEILAGDHSDIDAASRLPRGTE